MITTLMIFHAVVSVLLIVLVLLQFGKGAEAGLLTGGAGGLDSMNIKPRGNPLSKLTVVLSILFIGNSVLLARLQTTTATRSILDDEAPISRPLNFDDTIPMDSALPVDEQVQDEAGTEVSE